METIYNYNDYHLYLRDFYNQRKSEEFFFSYLYISLRLNMDLDEICEIFLGDQEIPTDKIEEFISFFELSTVEGAFFENLIYIEDTKKHTLDDIHNTLFHPVKLEKQIK